MNSSDLRQKYLDFFKSRKHVEIKPARIVLDNDPSTLFTSSGMQPLVSYLLGEAHPSGVRLVDSQPSFRSGDIEEVGDNRHTTFFEMLGNWSLGDYFKKEQLEWFFEFLTKELGLSIDNLYVSCFEGNETVPKDTESAQIWKGLGIPENRIFFYDAKKNWWSRFGPPEEMPVGEIGGPDSEVFFEFKEIEHDPKYGKKCHPNCDCGRFMEIGNSVFIEYKKTGDNEFEKLDQLNVDFGGGLERLTAAVNNNPDIFLIDLYKEVISEIEQGSGVEYKILPSPMRIISDHLRAAAFLILDGVVPSNKLQGYVLRRLLRRSAIKLRELNSKATTSLIFSKVVEVILEKYDGLFGVSKNDLSKVTQIIKDEIERFSKTLDKGLKEIEKIEKIDGKKAFDLYQTYGFPFEVTMEIFSKKSPQLTFNKLLPRYMKEFEKHRELSRTASVGMFKGGLAGHSETETKYHTATHLLHQALRDILGPEVFQKGSNINTERLRFDFSFDRKMTDEEIKKVEEIINERIKQDLKVDRKFMNLEDAKKLNAIGLFNEKYASEVSVYCIGPGFKLDPGAKDQRDRGGYYSAEFCGGPHVEHTGVIGGIKIVKEEAVSAGIRRVRAELTN